MSKNGLSGIQGYNSNTVAYLQQTITQLQAEVDTTKQKLEEAEKRLKKRDVGKMYWHDRYESLQEASHKSLAKLQAEVEALKCCGVCKHWSCGELCSNKKSPLVEALRYERCDYWEKGWVSSNGL